MRPFPQHSGVQEDILKSGDREKLQKRCTSKATLVGAGVDRAKERHGTNDLTG